MNPEHENPDAPRCGSCGRFMQVYERKERLVVYECCGHIRTKFRPQFRQAPEQYANL